MKTILSILSILICSNLAIAQTTAIPDANFEQALIDLGLDTGPVDGIVLTANIDTLTYLDVNLYSITDTIYDLSGIQDFTALTTLDCGYNRLSSLDLSFNTNLVFLNCTTNVITSLDLTQNTALTELHCGENQFSSLDLSQNTALTDLSGYFNYSLSYLNVKNGNNLNMNSFNFWYTPNLTCIEVDDPAYSTLNWTNIDSLASFSTNCCPGLALNIDSINSITCADSGTIFSSATGGVTPYTYTWNTIPSNSTLTTDSVGFHAVQVTDANGCNLTKGVLIDGPEHTGSFDLNTSLSVAGFRPGMLSNLNLFAWNDGCVLTSGQLSVSYSGPITFINSAITPNSNTSNTLTWNFTNWDYSFYQLFSSLEFMVDTTANLGDLVCFDISITPISGDADTSNNIKTYCYDVVNSYDPNDKQVYPQGVCAENYVLKEAPLTYTVRFQNTGNAPAINVFLLDTLSSNLNVNSLRIISKSHEPLTTEIINNNVIKFRFDNINLADSLSDEEGSKGYVTYEVSPNSGLVDGSIIENKAAIYFDFNAPIITNSTINTLIDVLPTPTTTILNENLGSGYSLNSQTYTTTGTYYQYFHSSTGCDSTVVLNLTNTVGIAETTPSSTLSIYPNPASNQLKIATQLAISKVSIVDLTGKIMTTTNQDKKLIDVTNLPQGIYFIKIETTGQTIIKKFVKQ